MVKAIIDLGEYEEKVVNVVKAKNGLKNKNDAINLIIREYSKDGLEEVLRPEVSKLRKGGLK